MTAGIEYSQEVNTCSFCRAETAVSRAYLHALNKPKVGDGFVFIYYCAECGLREEILDKRMCGNTAKSHQHKWEIDKFAGFIKTGIEGAYIICRNCGEVRLMEVNNPAR